MNTKKMCMICAIILTLYFGSIAYVMGQLPVVGFTPSATTNVLPGSSVAVNVTVTGMTSPGMYSYELKVKYNKTLLEATNAEIPSDHMLKPSLKAGNIFIVDSGTIDQAAGLVSFAATLLSDEPGKIGSGTLVTVTFKGLAKGVADLSLQDVILVDPNATAIPTANYTLGSGSITIIPEFTMVFLVMALLTASVAAVALKKKLK